MPAINIYLTYRTIYGDVFGQEWGDKPQFSWVTQSPVKIIGESP